MDWCEGLWEDGWVVFVPLRGGWLLRRGKAWVMVAARAPFGEREEGGDVSEV